MGAFILFPILLFSVFLTAVLGFTDWIHVDTLVHAAAQAAVQAAAEDAGATVSNGIYPGGTSATPPSVPLDAPTVRSTVAAMLSGWPYVTGYSCSANGSQVTCTVHFRVSMPILGTVNSSTTASSRNLVP